MTSWRYIPKYLIIFIAMVNGIVSLIPLSVFSLLMYRIVRDFCVLILFPATLLYSLMSSSNFLVESLGFYVEDHVIYSESFTSSFPIWVHFIFFLLWLLWPKLPKLCWIVVVRVGTLVLFLTVGEILPFFTNECNVCCGFVIYSFYYVEVCSFYFCFLECFLS